MMIATTRPAPSRMKIEEVATTKFSTSRITVLESSAARKITGERRPGSQFCWARARSGSPCGPVVS
jgi:hypothetical protein